MKKIQCITLCLFLIHIASFSQINKEDIIGDWITTNKDSAYFKHDTITFHQSVFYYLNEDNCFYIGWEINNLYFRYCKINDCSGIGELYEKHEELVFKLIDGVQYLIHKRDGKMIEKFEILSYKKIKLKEYFRAIRTLKVIRKRE